VRSTALLPALALAGLACAETTTPSADPAPGTYLLEMEGPFMAHPFLMAGDSALVAVRVVDARTGRPIPTSPVWTVSPPGVASLNAFNGHVTNEQGEPTSRHQAWVRGHGSGTVTVVARLGADSATIQLRVEQVAHIDIFQSEGPLPSAVRVGDTLTFQAFARTSQPNEFAYGTKVSWSVDQPGIASIGEFTSRIRESNCCGPEPYGPGLLVVALAPGQARLTATAGAVSASIALRVSP